MPGMSDSGSTQRRLGRRALTAVAVLSIAATGAAWAGCGGDDEDEAQQAIDEAQEQVDEAVDEAEQQAEEAEQQAEEAVDEAQQEAEQAEEEAEQQAEEAQQEAEDAAGGYGSGG
jgi:type IV secretory pathway VirB10-like protein